MKRREFMESLGIGVASGMAVLPGLGFLGCGKVPESSGPAASTASTTPAFPKIVHHGLMLGRPAKKPEGTKGIVAYELGNIFQLDRTHCLLVASMDEQGGPDLCVGNDGFIFEKLSDIQAEKAIPLNRVETNYKLKTGKGTGLLAKYPLTGAFVPLGAKLEDGRPHPGAGTGILVCTCMAFKSDRSDPIHGEGHYNSWEALVEVMQIKWTGEKLVITDISQPQNWLGHTPMDVPFSMFCESGASLIAPFRLEGGHHHPVRFDFDGKAWTPSKIGPHYELDQNEKEPSIRRQGQRYFIASRGGKGPKDRMYVSDDGLTFKFLFDWDNIQDTPTALSQGLDGSLYLATNRNKGWFRNPLYVLPMVGNGFGEPTILHDQDGVREDTDDKLPFIDHAMGNNVVLEGKWRHLICYRVCDLKERTLYGFQERVVKKIHGDTGPIPKRASSGMYLAELMYDHITNKPFLG